MRIGDAERQTRKIGIFWGQVNDNTRYGHGTDKSVIISVVIYGR
jgi:hypothetical protein